MNRIVRIDDAASPRARNGLPERFTAVYQQHAGQVQGYLRARGVDDAEAVMHDVFLALYPRLEGIRGGDEGIRSLLFSIAHARVVDHHRARVRRPDHVAYDPEGDDRRSESAEETALAGDLGALAVLRRLPDDYREVLALRVVADLSVDVTAEVMNRSCGAVKQLQRRALLALKNELVPQSGALA